MIKKVLLIVLIVIINAIDILIIYKIDNYINILEIVFKNKIDMTMITYSLISFIIVFLSSLISLAIIVVVKNKKTEIKGIKWKLEDGTYGTSNWMTDEELNSILGKNNTEGIILGTKDEDIIKIPFDSYFNKNIAVFGSSGSMKTISFLITNLLELTKTKKSIIVTDAKGEIYRKTNTLFRENGYIVKVLNLKDMEHSDRWNPLAENEDVTDIQTSSNVIITGTQKKAGKDDFWPRAEENLLKAFQFYFMEHKLEQNTLTDIYKSIAVGDIATLDNMFKKIPNDNPARMSYNIFASGSDTIKSSVLTGLGTRLQSFQNKELQELTNTTDIDLTLPGKEACIYYVISSDVDSSRDFLVSLFFTFLFIKLVKYADSKENGKLDNEVFFFLDEFANIGEIPDFNKKISTVRSRGISLIPIVQNIGQIKNRYPLDTWQEIIGNCDFRLCLGAADTLTAEYFSELIGVATVEQQGIRKSAGIEGYFEYGMENLGTMKRNLLNPDEILRLPYDQVLVNIRGNKPILLKKMIYTKHSLASNLKDNSILEYKPNWSNNTIVYSKDIQLEQNISKSTENINRNNEIINDFDTF